MDKNKDFLTRKQVKERTGWSLNFIDCRLPRVKIGGKILIPVRELERVLSGETVRD